MFDRHEGGVSSQLSRQRATKTTKVKNYWFRQVEVNAKSAAGCISRSVSQWIDKKNTVIRCKIGKAYLKNYIYTYVVFFCQINKFPNVSKHLKTTWGKKTYAITCVCHYDFEWTVIVFPMPIFQIFLGNHRFHSWHTRLFSDLRARNSDPSATRCVW